MVDIIFQSILLMNAERKTVFHHNFKPSKLVVFDACYCIARWEPMYRNMNLG